MGSAHGSQNHEPVVKAKSLDKGRSRVASQQDDDARKHAEEDVDREKLRAAVWCIFHGHGGDLARVRDRRIT